MKINWTVRLKNKAFWLALIPALLLVIQTVAALLGFTIDLGDVGDKLLAVVNAVFGVLVILGVVVDPTTEGVSDSERALCYDEPFPKIDLNIENWNVIQLTDFCNAIGIDIDGCARKEEILERIYKVLVEPKPPEDSSAAEPAGAAEE